MNRSHLPPRDEPRGSPREPSGFDDAVEILERAIGAGLFPAAVAEVGAAGDSLWRRACGSLSFDAGAPPATEETLFDLASLTKPIATTSAVLDLRARGALRLTEPVSAFFSEWTGLDRERVTVRDLLEHASGLPARLLDQPPEGRRAFEHDICATPLEYVPRSKSVYSDLGFILLGFLVEDRGGAPLDVVFAKVLAQLAESGGQAGETILMFTPSPELGGRTAPTRPLDEDRRRGRMLVAEVHDTYAAALGGIAGHAGLFGTASGVGAFARAVLRGARGDARSAAPFSPPIVALATHRSAVPLSSRALGWDTMLPTSSCGTRMSPDAFGHVGFTGCSLWIDPTRDRYFVLMTNRACGGGTIDEMRELRRAFHDALGAV